MKDVHDAASLRKFKKDTQFFETPDAIAEQMGEYIGLGRYHRVLEPSAGKGSLIFNLLNEYADTNWIEEVEFHCCETHEPFRDLLSEFFELVGRDFLDYLPEDSPKYDFILMNPPYSRNQGVKHVRHAWKHLNSSGRIVVLLPTGKQADEIQEEFMGYIRNFAIQPKSFKETTIETVIITIDKPMD